MFCTAFTAVTIAGTAELFENKFWALEYVKAQDV
jgi:hypothetical protein